MSSCLILQDKNNFYIGADTACSINIDGEYYRYSDNIEKIFTHGQDVYFCSGNMTIVNAINSWISVVFYNKPNIDIDALSMLLKKYYPFSDESIFDIEVIVCRKENNISKIYQISQYNNYNPIVYKSKNNGINILCSGYKTKELYDVSRSILLRGNTNVKDLYSIAFNLIYDNKVGGNIILYENGNKIMYTKIQEQNIKYANKHGELHLLLAQAVIAGYIEGSSIVGGTIKIGLQDNGSYAFEVTADGVVTMHAGTVDGYATTDSLESVKNEVDAINSSKMYKVEITANNSTIISSTTDKSTLTCRVYSWDTDITENLDSSLFAWKRTSMDTTQDEVWNAMPEHQGVKSIIIDADDVIGNSSFTCEVNLPE